MLCYASVCEHHKRQESGGFVPQIVNILRGSSKLLWITIYIYIYIRIWTCFFFIFDNLMEEYLNLNSSHEEAILIELQDS